MSDRFLDFHKVKAITSIGRSYCYKLIRAGEFPAPVKLGKKSVWPESHIQQWIADRIANPPRIGRPANKRYP